MKKPAKRKTAARPSAIRFELYSPGAGRVSLAGSFNQWDPNVMPMTPSVRGTWTREICLGPGTYEYCFVVDGHWMKDPRAKDSVANPFGGFNSVLTVADENKSATSCSETTAN